MIWTGLSFAVLGHHDGRFLHLPGRVDQVQLLARVVRHTQPLLNCLNEAHAPPAAAEPARRRA